MLGSGDNRLMDTGQVQGNLRKEAVLEVCEVLSWHLFFFFFNVGKSFQMKKTINDPETCSCVPLETGNC